MRVDDFNHANCFFILAFRQTVASKYFEIKQAKNS